MEELFWSVWQLNKLMCGFPRQPAKLWWARVPEQPNSTSASICLWSYHFLSEGMFFTGLKYLSPACFLRLTEQHRPSVPLTETVDHVGKYNQDGRVLRSSRAPLIIGHTERTGMCHAGMSDSFDRYLIPLVPHQHKIPPD